MTIQDIISGVSKALISTGCQIHEDELKQGFKEHDLIIQVVNTSLEFVMTNRYKGIFSLDIIYYDSSKESAYKMAATIIDAIEMISTTDGDVRGDNISSRYVTDAMHVFITYTVDLKRPQDKDVLMHKLTIGEDVNNG